jgi:cold shock CspA family protein
MGKATGVSKWFSRLKGYGYINPDDDGYDDYRHDLGHNDGDYRDYHSHNQKNSDSKLKNSSSRRK